MRRHKVRYRSGQSIVVAHAEESPPWGGYEGRTEFHDSENHRWLTEYEVLEGERSTKAQFNNCDHKRIYSLPASVSTLDSRSRRISEGDPSQDVVAYGQNVDAAALSVVLPHFPHSPEQFPFAPRGATITVGIDDVPANEGPLIHHMHDFIDAQVNLDKVASSGLELFRNSVCKFDDFSIANFLWELRDVRRLIRMLKPLAEKEQWALLARPDLPDKKNIPFNIADSHLAFKFGAVPLINDVLTILRGLANAQKRVKYLLRNLHRIKVIKALIKQYRVEKCPLWPDVYQQFGQTLSDGMPDYRSGDAFVTGTSSEFTPKVGMKYTLFCEELSKINLQLAVYLELFGIKWDPVYVWNAIPFSFILDWIWDIAGWLGRLEKISMLPVKLRVMDFYIMWEYQARYLVFCPGGSSVEHIDQQDTDIVPRSGKYQLTADRFRRLVFMPDYRHLHMAKWDQNVVDKTLLGASLYTTNVAYQNRPLRVPSRFGPSKRTLRRLNAWLGIGKRGVSFVPRH